MASSERSRARLFLASIVFLAPACASPDAPSSSPSVVSSDDDSEFEQTAQPITGSSCVLTTYGGLNIFRRSCSDGMTFYTRDGNTFSSGGTRTGYEWQCVEWTNRYFHWHWGTPLPWYGNATDKCASHPSSVSRVTTPWWGDIVVFRPNACLKVSSGGGCAARAHATYGHIGIVTSFPSSTTMRVKDQNGPQNAYNDYIRTAVSGYSNPVQCYLRDSHHVCQVGSTRSCTSGGCSGRQTCASTGRSWGSCAITSCPDAGTVDAAREAGSDVVAVADVIDETVDDAGDPMVVDDVIDEPIVEDDVPETPDDAADPTVVEYDADDPDAAVEDGAASDGPVAPDAGGERSNLVGGCACSVPLGTVPRGGYGAMVIAALAFVRKRRRGQS